MKNNLLWCVLALAVLITSHGEVGVDAASRAEDAEEIVVSRALTLRSFGCSLSTSSEENGEHLSFRFALEGIGDVSECESYTITIYTRTFNDSRSRADEFVVLGSSSLCYVCHSSSSLGVDCAVALQDPPLDAISLRIQVSSGTDDLKHVDLSTLERTSLEQPFVVSVFDSLTQDVQSLVCQRDGPTLEPSRSSSLSPLSARIMAEVADDYTESELVDLCRSLIGSQRSHVVITSNKSCEIIYRAADECRRWRRFEVLDRSRLRELARGWHLRDFDALPPLPASILARNGVLIWNHFHDLNLNAMTMIQPSSWARLVDVMLIEISDLSHCHTLGIKCVPVPILGRTDGELEEADIVYVPCNIVDLVPDLVLPNLRSPVIFLSHIFPFESISSCSTLEPELAMSALDQEQVFR